MVYKFVVSLFDAPDLGVLFNQLYIPKSWPWHFLTYLTWIFHRKYQERCRSLKRENSLRKIVKKEYRNNLLPQLSFRALSFVPLSLSMLSAVRSELYLPPSSFLNWQGVIASWHHQLNPLYEADPFVLLKQIKNTVRTSIAAILRNLQWNKQQLTRTTRRSYDFSRFLTATTSYT